MNAPRRTGTADAHATAPHGPDPFLQGARHAGMHTPGRSEAHTLLLLRPDHDADGLERLARVFDTHTTLHEPDPAWDPRFTRGWLAVMKPVLDPRRLTADEDLMTRLTVVACTSRSDVEYTRNAINAILRSRAAAIGGDARGGGRPDNDGRDHSHLLS